MREMKDSGIEWIGEIPASWKITKLKNVAEKFCNGSSETQLANGESSFPVTRIETISKGFIDYEKTGYVEYLSSKYRLDKYDFLVSNINSIAYLGNCAIYLDENVLYHGMNLLRITPTNINVWYLFYYFKSMAFKRNMQVVCKPAINQASVSASNIKNMYIPIPDEKEQKHISKYLDKKCSEIDLLISNIQSQIEALEEYKRSVITEAVTKGLDPDVEMRDSGIAWVGDVPKHWKICKLRYSLKKIGDVDHYMPKTVDMGFPYIMIGNLSDRVSLINLEDCKKISHMDYQALSMKMKSEKDDVIFARYATIGTVCYVDVDKEFLVSYACVTVRTNKEKLIGKFLYYYFRSLSFLEEVKQYINSNTQGNVGIESLYRVRIALPTIKEQLEIAKFLDNKITKIDSIIADKKKQIETIEEYKKSLIFEYVTGKKEVRV